MDGDLVVALSTGLSGRQGNLMQAATLGARALEKAILDAVRSATGTPTLPSVNDLAGKGGRSHD
jgi:L-aminopeptidase/D-esterase-like protein